MNATSTDELYKLNGKANAVMLKEFDVCKQQRTDQLLLSASLLILISEANIIPFDYIFSTTTVSAIP